MKAILCILLLVCQLEKAAGQKENNNWAFGKAMGMTFNTSPPTLISTAFNTIYSGFLPSAVSDASGNLLFYTNGRFVWNRNHQVMPNGYDITQIPNPVGHWAGPYNEEVTSVVIIPDPGNSNRYYIITTGWGYRTTTPKNDDHYFQARYSIVDMSLQAGMGDVVQDNKNLLFSNDTLDFPVVAAGNGYCNKWVLLKKERSNNLLAFKITPAGIDPAPVISAVSQGWAFKITLSDDNQKLGIISWNLANYSYPLSVLDEFIHLYDFDILTGTLSNSILINSRTGINSDVLFINMAFSADDSKFYYLENNGTTPNPNIYQYNLQQPTPAAIINSKTSVFSQGTHLTLSKGLTNGPDQKIYTMTDSGKFVVINHPDRGGISCDTRIMQLLGPWNPASQTLDKQQNAVPVSNVISSYSDFNTCTLPAQLSSHKNSADNYQWNTGATTKSITATQNGTYWVKASDVCGAYHIDTFHINFSPPTSIPDTFSCNGQPLILPEDPTCTYTWHNTQGPVINYTGQYSVTISKGICGTLEDTFFVTILPPIGVKILPADTTICNAAMTAEIGCNYEMGQYLWNTGATNKNITVNKPGTYWLECNTPCGIYRDSITVGFCAAQIKDVIAPDSTCMGSCVHIAADAGNYPQQYQWTFEGGTPPLLNTSTPETEVCYNDTGDFTISVTASNAGGSSTLFKKIRVLPAPIGRFTDTALTVDYKTILLLPACADAAQIRWYKNGQVVCENCSSLQITAKELQSTYTCVVQNATCTDTCHYTVHVLEIPTDAWLPNAFSPNGDGRNDYFRIVTDNPNIQNIALFVYNRFGQKVYSSQQGDKGWDGKFNSTPLDVGTYFWYLSYKVAGHNETFFLKGDLILMR